MKIYFVLLLMLTMVTGFTIAIDRGSGREDIDHAIKRSIPLLERSSHIFLENAGGCHSCHGQGLGAVVFSLAKEKGFEISDTVLTEALNSIAETWKSRAAFLAQAEDPIAIVISGGYDMWAWASTETQPTKMMQLGARNIFQRQRTDGSWVSPSSRPPMEYYSISATALSIQGLQRYLPAADQLLWKEKLQLARNWLSQQEPVANEEKAFQLLGLHWANAAADIISRQTKKLLADQRPDGGWSQLNTLPSDAYATGQSLYALHLAGKLSTASNAYKKGIEFLLNQQQADGSWRIKTRSFPSVPYVDSGFPHKDDQFISAAGSNWATLALLLAANN